MKKLIASAICLVVGIAIAMPIKGNLASRETGNLQKEISGPTAQDYIQDGLVAMWDGIENIGWGQHDDNATIWKDLVGSYDITLNNCSLDSSSVVFNGSTSYGRCSSTLPSGISTAEIALTPYDLNTSNQGTWFLFDCLKDSPFGFAHYRSLFMLGGSSIRNKCFQCGNARYIAHNKSICFFNGVGHTSSDIDSWSSSNTGISVGARNRNDFPSKYHGSIHCIRLYSRSLTAEEIAYNYNIDKERFGL